MNLDEIKYAMKNLMNRKLRSWLTVLSILIGVMAIFSILSFGMGIRNYMDVLAQEAGSDKFFIQARGASAPGSDINFYVAEEDVNYVSKINGVRKISPLHMKPVQVKRDRETKYVFATGYDTREYDFIFETFTIDLLKGRKLKDKETDKVTLGYSYMFPNKVFKRGLNLGDKIEVNGHTFRIVGFYEEVGNPQDDSNIYMTLEGIEKLFPETKGKYAMAMGQAEPATDVGDLAEKISDKLRKTKGQDKGKEDFFVQTFEDAIATFGTIIDILNGILALIALVSLIVASVNIMNTMYTAVIERKKEIGIMKAVGARNSDIMFVFIFEAGVLGMVGGIIGVIFGYSVATAAGNFAANAGYALLQPIFPVSLIMGCIMFAFFVGAIAGVLPARQAAKLNPVEALRENE